MNLPTYPQPGQPVRAEWARDVIDYLRSLTPRHSATISSQHTPGGTTYSVILVPPNNAFEEIHPFQLIDASTDDELRVQVKASTLGDDELEDYFEPGDDPPFYFVVTASGYVWGFVEIDAEGAIQELGIANGASVPTSDATHAYVPIGSYSVSGSPPALTVQNSRYGPIPVTVCRNWFSNPPTFGISFE